MNPIAEYAKQLDRSRRDYRTQTERAADDYITKVRDTVCDILDYLNSYYPFQEGYFTKLKETVFYQLDLVLHRRRDLSHQAIGDLCRNGNIDWFAEPFFGVRKLKLSKLLHEYDDYRYERAGPSPDCYAYFQINRSHGEDDRADRPDDRPYEEAAEDDRGHERDWSDYRAGDRGGDGDFKRQRTGSARSESA